MVAYDANTNSFVGDEIIYGSVPNVMWHITDVCPLRCPYCFAPKTNLATSTEVMEHRITVLKAIGVLKVDISGGEPLAYVGLPQLCSAVAAHGIAQTITTSGVGSEGNKHFIFNEIDIFSRVIVSLDAPSAGSHDTFRGPGTFKAALNLLQIIKERRAGSLRVNTVVTRSFIKGGWLEQMVALMRSLGAEWCLIQPHPANEKPGFREHAISDAEFFEFETAVREIGGVKTLFRRASQYSSYWSLQPNGELRQHTSCSADGLSLNVDELKVEQIKRLLSTTSGWVPTKRYDHEH